MYQRIFYGTAVFTLVLTAVIMYVAGYWLFYPRKIIDIYNNDRIAVNKTHYSKGERIVYTLQYCKYKNAPATVSRALVNSIRINYTAYYNNLTIGCSTVSNADLVIPEFVDSGTYHLEAFIEYKVNPIRKITNSWRSVDFTIE